MTDTARLNNILIKLTESQSKLSDLSTPEVEGVVNCRLANFDDNVIKRILASKQLITNKDEQLFIEYVEGGSVLHFLAFLGCEESCEWALKNGSYPHAINMNGNTPLHSAVVSNQTECIKSLKFYHADIYSENMDGKTPLDVSQGNDDSKEALLSVRFSSEEVETEYLQERLPQLVEKVLAIKTDPDEKVHCLKCLRAEMRMATSSMSSVPKPLKILKEKYDSLKEGFALLDPDNTNIRPLLADVLSILAMTMEDLDRDCIRYRLCGSNEKVDSFGHPYIRRLCLQISLEWTGVENPERLSSLVLLIVQYCLAHNAEEEACDLLMEVERIDRIIDYVTMETHERVCLYLTSCVKYVSEPEDTILIKTAMTIYRKFNGYPAALRLAMMLNQMDLVKEIFLECQDTLVQKQLAFMLGRQQIFLDLDDSDTVDQEDLTEIMQNVHLNNNFLGLARELDIMAPKQPEDIYKTHLEHARFSTAQPLDSARANLASSFVNGFVNCAFGQDQLVMEDGSKWLYKHKSYGMLSAAASIGLVLLWDVEGGLTEIDKFLYSTEDYIKAGALLACGVVNCGVRNECEPALALLTDYIQHESNVMRLGSIIGLGLAYSGSHREDVIDLMTPVLWDTNSTFEVVCLAALSCSMVAIGSCHGDLGESFLQIMMDPERLNDLSTTHSRYLALALGLLFIGKQETVEAVLVALQAVPEPFSSFASVLLQICAYAGTGNVLKIQSLLHLCSEYFGDKDEENSGEGGEKTENKRNSTGAETGGTKRKSKSGDEKESKKEDKTEPGSLSEPGSHQALAVLGIALISMGEDIGSQMAMRAFNHLLRYGEPVIRRAVPLALALMSTSNPEISILDTLSKFSHDSDSTVARNAIFAMGILGSGTNNARLAGLLRNLAQFYHKEPLDLFMVRLAQGLTHLGKGTLTLNPFHSDRALMTPVSIGGLLTVMIAMLDSANTILSTSHYMLYYLVSAVQPRMLVTFDENMSPLSVSVRVGQAVDVVGQAGKPKTITGFQTHTTPVLLAHGERAELATNEYIPLTPIIEGFVILKKDPNYSED